MDLLIVISLHRRRQISLRNWLRMVRVVLNLVILLLFISTLYLINRPFLIHMVLGWWTPVTDVLWRVFCVISLLTTLISMLSWIIVIWHSFNPWLIFIQIYHDLTLSALFLIFEWEDMTEGLLVWIFRFPSTYILAFMLKLIVLIVHKRIPLHHSANSSRLPRHLLYLIKQIHDLLPVIRRIIAILPINSKHNFLAHFTGGLSLSFSIA
jgi:hypothetical protein